MERLSTMKVKYFFAGESFVHNIEVTWGGVAPLAHACVSFQFLSET